MYDIIEEPAEFEWDEGNINKNSKHQVNDQEAEQAFLDTGKQIYKDILHSEHEDRFILIGRTERERLLYIVFTKRKAKIRIISARDINKKEKGKYEKKA